MQLIEKQASLYYREGASDKVYHAQIAQEDGGFVVAFQYGRRGSTLTTGKKTASPVSLEKAQLVFEKLVKEKMGKGYTSGDEGTPFACSPNAQRVSEISLQLLNAVSRNDAETLLGDDDWLMQEKIDGERRAVIFDGQSVTGVNRKGLTVALPETIAQTIAQCVPPQTILDGEQVGDRLFLFDILKYRGEDLRAMTYSERHQTLLSAIPAATHSTHPLRVVAAHKGAALKRAVFDALERSGAEGVVFKRRDSAYTAGRPSSGGDQLKCKFYETATVRVMAVNDGVRSVRIAMLTDDGALQDVGNVTVPPNQPIPSPGDHIEVFYLYAYPNGGSLYQPTLTRARPDKDVPDAISSLKFKVSY